MATNAEFGRRLRDAKRDWEKAHDTGLGWRELGERIGAALGREPFAAAVVQRWFMQGRVPEDVLTILPAIARVLEADPAYLFGIPVLGDVGKNGDAVTLRSGVPDPFRATGEVVPHSAYVKATTPTAAEREAEEREAARHRRPGATGRKRRA